MPSENGRRLKMRYLMQIKTRPPTFFLFVNRKNLLSDNFEHFVRNSLAKEFGFVGSPIRILIRDNRTQYAKRRLSQLTPAASSILGRIKAYKARAKNVTLRRRLSGNRFLYRGK